MNIPPTNITLKLEELNGWRNKRVEEYGQMGSQLNLLWDDINNGLLGEQAKTGTGFLHIQSIKDNIEKPDVEAIEQELQTLFGEQDN